MNNEYKKIIETANFIKEKADINPKIAMILGSGTGAFTDNIEDSIEFKYEEIPNFPVSTVNGHEGKLVLGTVKGKKVIAMKGRFHYYEGYDMKEVTFPIRVFKMLGVEKLIIVTASGAVNKDLNTGDLVIINDYIKLTALSPLRGENIEEFGPRFPNMNTGFDNELLKEIFKENDIEPKEGVFAFMAGPQYETRSEVNMLRMLGADVVAMSTVPEIIVGKHMSLDVNVICCVTNSVNDAAHLSHEEVVKVANANKDKLKNVLLSYIERM